MYIYIYDCLSDGGDTEESLMEDTMEKKGLIREFKQFISRGNVMDMAVGVIIGSAFTAIVNSLVKDLLMPIIGLALGKVNFDNLKIVLTPGDEAAGIAEAAINYGTFIQNIINFLLMEPLLIK